MKKLLFILFALGTYATTKATVRTVSNDPNGGAQYNTLQAAYNAAVNGDTLYLEGTDINYQVSNLSQPWAKALVVMGIGVRPAKSSPRKSKIAGIGNGFFFMNALGSGSKFYGVQFMLQPSFSVSITNITYENCEFATTYDFQGINFSNFSFRNCWFHSVNFNSGNFSNLFFTSCIFNGAVNGNTNPNVSSTILDHCLFLTSGTCTSGMINTTISNCIFMNCTSIGTLYNSYVVNNIARLNNVFNSVGTGNTIGGNISNTDPMLVNCPINAGFADGISRNYHLLSGSPCIGAGTGGSDIGPHGSITHFNESGEVLFAPIMRTLFINNTNVVPNGTLNVQIYATKPNNN